MRIPKIVISGREICTTQPPYIVAELSANHNGSLEIAKKIIDESVKAGADAVKIQTFRPDTITLDCDDDQFLITGGLWDGRRLYDLYDEAHLPWEWHSPLFRHAERSGISIFSTPFDNTAVDLLEDLNCPAYKIASFEAVDLPLIRYVASTGKPMIISTGIVDAEEIEEAVTAAREAGCNELAILHCVSSYPAQPEDYNLLTIRDMLDRFGLVTGLSDHTLGNTIAIGSVMFGASIIEKHITLDRAGSGLDDSFSTEPTEFASLCRDTRTAWRAMGRVNYDKKLSEKNSVLFKRSLYFVRDMRRGDQIDGDCVRSVRPGDGLAPKHLDKLIGRKVNKDIRIFSPVSWSDVVE